ncbi:hypothetical protein [Desulfosediminicola sp.]|uniref:hypothetical protein n=1 Tax=Desulfosediminicola sp. TaxID=2886825 RepID=UPI003AF1F74F
MKTHVILLIILLISTPCFSKEMKEYNFVMSLDDEFIVRETDDLNVDVQKELTLRFADVKITPKQDNSFSMMLYFKCDTKDLAQFDSLSKIKKSVKRSSEKYLPYVFEKEIKLIDVNWKGQYGSYCILTDSALANAKSIPPNQFKYLTRGMVRLSEDSALGFSLMTNEINTEKYQEMLSHIKSWIK